MSESRMLSISETRLPIWAIAVLAVVFGFGLFTVGFDQGHMFSVVLGEQAFDEMWIHELSHDMRHAAGFPCH